jgi:hypothetical protein
MQHNMDYEECLGQGKKYFAVSHDVHRSCTVMVHQVPDDYTVRIVKNINRDWESFAKGISEVEISVIVYHRYEIN